MPVKTRHLAVKNRNENRKETDCRRKYGFCEEARDLIQIILLVGTLVEISSNFFSSSRTQNKLERFFCLNFSDFLSQSTFVCPTLSVGSKPYL